MAYLDALGLIEEAVNYNCNRNCPKCRTPLRIGRGVGFVCDRCEWFLVVLPRAPLLEAA